MANPDIGKIIFTYAGRDLMSKCQIGKELHYSKFLLSDGEVTDSEDLRNRTTLVNSAKLNAPIVGVRVLGNGHAQIQAQISNQDLETGFFTRELGIIAIDPDTEEEILYAYANFGNASNYIPSAARGIVQTVDWTVETIIDQATNITATIDGSTVFVTHATFNDHVYDSNPHPNVPIKKTQIEFPSEIWAADNDSDLHKISINALRRTVLGTDSATIPLMNSRISQLEIELSNLIIKDLANSEAPDSNLIVYEDFENPDMIDRFSARVTSVMAGSDSIDLETLTGIHVGAWYWISDGRNQEYVKIKSVSKNGSIYRAILTRVLQKTYSDTATKLYRTTAEISNGSAFGSGDQRTIQYLPSLIWTGIVGTASTTIELDTSLNHSAEFEHDGDVQFNASGFFTLQA